MDNNLAWIHQITDYTHSFLSWCWDIWAVSASQPWPWIQDRPDNWCVQQAYNAFLGVEVKPDDDRRKGVLFQLAIWMIANQASWQFSRGRWCRFQQQVTVNRWLHCCWPWLAQQSFTDPTIGWLVCCYTASWIASSRSKVPGFFRSPILQYCNVVPPS